MEHIFANLIVTRVANYMGIYDLSLISICVGSFTGIFQSLKEIILNPNNNNHQYFTDYTFIKWIQDYSNLIMYLCIFLFFVCFIYFLITKQTKIKRESIEISNQNSLSLLLSTEQHVLVNYIKQYPFILKKHQQMKIGLINELERERNSFGSYADFSGTLYNELNIPIKFYDTNFHVSVEIVWLKSEDIKEGKEKDIKIITYYPKITLNEPNEQFPHSYIYFKAIEKLLENQSKDKIKTITSKICPIKKSVNQEYSFSLRNCSTLLTELYFGSQLTLEEKNELFLNSYFKHQKQFIFPHLYKIENDPMYFIKFGQIPKYGALFHGPTGSGKSSLIYRLARYLDRNIILIDLKEIYEKKHLYELLNNPYTGNKHGNLIVLEEIDISLEILYEIDQKNKKNDIKSDDNTVIENYDKSSIPSTFQLIDKIQNINYSKYDYTLRDLLSIFDGPSPENGRIIIATTNHYDKICKYCPELFRHGRLTPIYIGYLTLSELQELCLYYFQQTLNDEQIKQIEHQFDQNGELKIKTSKITEHILSLLMTKQNCENVFQSFVIFLINN